MSLLKQNTTKTRQIDKNNVTKLDAGGNKDGKYKVESIYNSAVYAKESADHLSRLYYLVF